MHGSAAAAPPIWILFKSFFSSALKRFVVISKRMRPKQFQIEHISFGIVLFWSLHNLLWMRFFLLHCVEQRPRSQSYFLLWNKVCYWDCCCSRVYISSYEHYFIYVICSFGAYITFIRVEFISKRHLFFCNSTCSAIKFNASRRFSFIWNDSVERDAVLIFRPER